MNYFFHSSPSQVELFPLSNLMMLKMMVSVKEQSISCIVDVMAISQMRTIKALAIMPLTWGHSARKVWSQGSSPSLLDSKDHNFGHSTTSFFLLTALSWEASVHPAGFTLKQHYIYEMLTAFPQFKSTIATNCCNPKKAKVTTLNCFQDMRQMARIYF